MIRNVVLLVAAWALLPTVAQAKVLWRGDFETGDLSQWSKSQMVSADRLRVVSSPAAQGAKALRVEVRQGDNPIGASGNRNELAYLSYEPRGTERYYRWQTMFDPSYPSNATWQVFTQWHHSGDSGSPPVEFDVYGESIALEVNGQTVWHAPLVRGVWHDFVFHVRWSPDASEGFVELWYDGELVLPRLATVTQFSGQSQYLKQGLYRNNTITQTGVVFHDGFIIGETLADVMPAPAAADAGASAGPDAAASPVADAAAPGPDAAAAGPDAGQAGPDASEAGPDATAEAGDDASQREPAADAGTEAPADSGQEPVRPDAEIAPSQADASLPVAPDAGEVDLPDSEIDEGEALPPTGCASVPGSGGGLASLGIVLGLAALFLQRRK